MKTITCVMALMCWLGLHSANAEIKRVSDGGVEVNLSDLLPNDEPAVIVFHVPWDQTCISLLEEVESWADQYPNITVIFVDVVDERTQAYRQFSLEKYPSILVYDKEQERTGPVIDSVSDLEELLSDKGFI